MAETRRSRSVTAETRRTRSLVAQVSPRPADPLTGEVRQTRRVGAEARRSGSSTALVSPDVGSDALNVLVFLLDDVGIDQVSAYDVIGPWGGQYQYAPQPNLATLAATGRVYTWAFTTPVCSPTRAQVMTGFRAHRTGIGTVVNKGETWRLREGMDRVGARAFGELARQFSGASRKVGFFGKWHLGAGNGDPTSPDRDGGCDYYSGSLINPQFNADGNYGYQGPYVWTDITSPGGTPVQTTYTDTGNDSMETRMESAAIAWLSARQSEGVPWVCYVAFHFCHGEYGYVPPTSYHSEGAGPFTTVVQSYKAYLSAADTMIGNILGALSASERARTLVIVMGDNGTDHLALEPEQRTVGGLPDPPSVQFVIPGRAKGTVFNSGIRVPLIVNLPGYVVPGYYPYPVESTDVFATVADFTGHLPYAPAGMDGISLRDTLQNEKLPSRKYVYIQNHKPNGLDRESWTEFQAAVVGVKSLRKLMVDKSGKWWEFDLVYDPFELNNLLNPDAPDEGVDQWLAGQRASEDLWTEYWRLQAEG